MDAEAYIERLYAGFSGAPRPRQEEITPHRCCECDEVAARLAPHASRDVPEQDMHWLGDSLPLLGPKAFRYYLPRYIEFCLRTRHSSLDALVNYNLAPAAGLDEGERNRFADFTPAEGALVLEFVEYRAGLEGAEYDRDYLDRALAYWRAAPA